MAAIGFCGMAAEIDVAKAALRDGLFEVARRHADVSQADEARLVILESHAREGHWDAVLAALDNWGNPEGNVYAYYRIAAYVKTGKFDSARRLLAASDFTGSSFAAGAALLAAETALASANSAQALRLLSGDASVSAKMIAARAQEQAGNRQAAERFWREVLQMTNADERAVSVAAANLGDAKALRTSYEQAVSPSVRRFAGLRLGVQLIKAEATFAEGAKLIETIARDVPDSDGAKDAFILLAEARLDRGEGALAAAAFAEALEMWPEARKDAAVQESRGWALSRIGRREEAREAFKTSLAVAADDEGRALVLVKLGDMTAEEGDLEESLRLYREVAEKYPTTAAGKRVTATVRLRELERQGRTLFSEYRFDEAMKAFAEVAAADAVRAPRMRYLMMMCLYGQGRDEEAESRATALSRDERDVGVRVDATLWLAKFAFNRGRWKDAGRLFAAAAELSPTAGDALLWSARAAFADNDFARAIKLVTDFVASAGDSPLRFAALLVQAEALIELARFDEAVLVLEQVAGSAGSAERLRAQLLRADAFFAMGADNSARYRSALESYRALLLGEALSPSERIVVAYKVARTLEKLKRLEEAIDQYYTRVVLAYRDGRAEGVRYGEEAKTAFARAAFRLSEEYESRGRSFQAVKLLELVVKSDVAAADEAARRIQRINKKGRFL